MLYSCTHMATEGVKALKSSVITFEVYTPITAASHVCDNPASFGTRRTMRQDNPHYHHCP